MTRSQAKPSSFMRRALDLAAQGDNKVRSNPKVGCVIVNGGRIVGEGYHAVFGGRHAEIIALEKAGKKAAGSTVYLTLEPCVHTRKKTPPCVPALSKYGVREVVLAGLDPNPQVSGKGARALRKAGIRVKVGTLRKEAEKLNRPFFTWVKKKRPYVFLKLAGTLDGKITGRSRWISNAPSRRRVQELRAQTDAILVGVNTVLSDNPRLSCRFPGARQPLRVILDSRLRSPLSSKVFRDSNVLVFTTNKADFRKRAAFSKRAIPVVICPSGKPELKSVLRTLAKRDVSSLLVEGGATVASSFLEENLVDRALFFVSPVLSSEGKPLLAGRLQKKFFGAKVSVLEDNALFDVELHPNKE